MPVAVYTLVPVDKKDLRKAVRKCVDVIRAGADDLTGIEISLGLICRTYRGVLHELAKRLPPSALGFENMDSRRDQTAGEFKLQASTGLASF